MILSQEFPLLLKRLDRYTSITDKCYLCNNWSVLEEAMLTACRSMVNRYLVNDFQSKHKILEDIYREFLNLKAEEKTADRIVAILTAFAREASVPRGGVFNFYKAQYGKTHSAEAFYNCLVDNDLERLVNYLKKRVETQPEEKLQKSIKLD